VDEIGKSPAACQPMMEEQIKDPIRPRECLANEHLQFYGFRDAGSAWIFHFHFQFRLQK